MALKLALIGFGRMGKEIARLAETRGHEIVATFNSRHPLNVEKASESVDVFVEFTRPDAVVENIKRVAKLRRPMVVGTTGWYDHLETVKRIVQQAESGLVYASNFSPGMNLFFKIVAEASRLLEAFDQYDPYIQELHHRNKVDSPSGTALTLGKIVLDNLSRKSDLHCRNLEGKISTEQVHISSIRAGHIPGTHVVGFDSEADTIELKHTARNRSGFALGALLAAEWIVGKQGIFTMDDFLRDLVREKNDDR